jgi:hypothetical protein
MELKCAKVFPFLYTFYLWTVFLFHITKEYEKIVIKKILETQEKASDQSCIENFWDMRQKKKIETQ